MRCFLALVALALCSADAGACDGRVAAWFQSHRPVRTFVANHRPGVVFPLPAQSAPAGYPTAAAGCPCGAACPCVPQAAAWNNCGSYACPANGGPAPAFGPAFAPAAPAYSSCPGGVCPAPARGGPFRRW